LIQFIKSEGFYREGSTDWLTTGFYTSDYRTGTGREKNLHIEMIPPGPVEFRMMKRADQGFPWCIDMLTPNRRTQVTAYKTRAAARAELKRLNAELNQEGE
jgi:hypothetical protein